MNNNNTFEIFYYIIMLFLILFFLIGGIALSYFNNQTIDITVKDKYVKYTTYFVVDTNNNTYEITDLFFLGKFNSTDIYNEIEIGNSYQIETTGFRIPFLSRYKNINKYRIVETYVNQ